MPKVSVLIPTYNSASFLDDAIQSVLNQTFTDFELIIVDNCSTDNSKEVISKYLPDTRIRFYVNEKNLGSNGNFNKCFSLATGEYIKCLCSDDKLHLSLLEKFVFVMDEHPSVSLVSSFFEEFGSVTKIIKPRFSGLLDGRKVINEVLSTKNFLGNPSQVMFRREGFKVGFFREMSVWNVDLEFFFRILSTGNGYIIPEVLSYTRIHNAAASHSMIRNFANYFGNYDLVKALEINESNLDFSGIDIKKFVKSKAKECTLVLPRTVTGLQKKQNRQAFIKALKIAYKEGVLFSSFPVIGKRIFQKTLS
jgi:glycosyltransferase involved in cell wall biosynthesis